MELHGARSAVGVTWVPDDRVAAGTTVIASLTGIVDDAGNPSLPIDTLEVIRKQASTLSVRVLRVRAQRVTFEYTASRSLLGRSMSIEGLVGGEWQGIRAFEAESTAGTFSVERGISERIRIRWLGDDIVVPALSKSRPLP